MLGPFVARTRVAYFSMEVALRSEMHTYAGGLGVLAGDTARSCADLELPVVLVTLVSRAGYFRQSIDAEGRQCEAPDPWAPGEWCTPLDAMVAITIEGRPVWVRPWLHLLDSPVGRRLPVLLLDTDLAQNAPADREITHRLYGGDATYRLQQEIVLGIGGVRLLRALGFEPHTYHLNEGHAALLALELLAQRRTAMPEGTGDDPAYGVADVRARCVFTTHTPVEGAQDQFDYALFERLLPGFVEPAVLRALAGADRLNMTRLALNLSGWVNGVSERHAQTAGRLYPGHRVRAVTNGVHLGTWAHEAFARLFDEHLPHWRHEPESLARASQLPDAGLRRCHEAAKADLLRCVHARTGVSLDPAQPVIGFARRMTAYKRPLLLFADMARLAAIAARHPFQVVLAGKAHPRDEGGKEAVRRIHALLRELPPGIRAVFLPNHDMDLAKVLVSGADVWLNTPLPPLEASGTSGMKAALNGVPNLSVLDGWWLEACEDGVNGWAIGADPAAAGKAAPARDDEHAAALYDTLEHAVLPLVERDPARWAAVMKQAIRSVPSHFNSHRMMRRYGSEVYLR